MAGAWRAVVLWVVVFACPAATLSSDADTSPEPEKYPIFSDKLDLGLVQTSGNTESTNVKLSNELKLEWPASHLLFKVQLLRVETGRRTIEPDFEDPADPELRVEWIDEKTNELYEGRLEFHREIHERLGWFALSAYSQNRPAGYDTRASVGAGLSYTHPRPAGELLRLEAGLSGNRDEPTGRASTSYFGAREALRFEAPVFERGRFEGFLELLQDLEESANHRARLDLALSTALNHRFSLKVSYQVRYDHLPQTKAYPNPEPDLGPDLVFSFDELDTVFSTSLVATF